jgi:hypothetical protein
MKYYLALCCVIKNERYLEEFVMYYKVLGVEHFYIYDNESNPPISSRLSGFYYNRICTIINFPGNPVQLESYHHCLHNYGHETNWLIVCDGDEYILPKKHFSLRDFLNEYEHAQAIGINWLFFGTSFYENKQDGFLIDKYRHCDNTQNYHIKTICKPKYTYRFNEPHSVIVQDPSKYIDCKNNILNGPYNHNITNDIIQINHYHGKSIEDHIEKSKRGYPDGVPPYKLPENLNSLHNNFNNNICNLIADKYLYHVIREQRKSAVN